VVRDEGDSWGTGCTSYRDVAGTFKRRSAPKIVERGPVRTITESVWFYRKSRLVVLTIVYPDWPVVEFRMRLLWNEERRRLKLAIRSAFRAEEILCEIPGGAIVRPADGEEHVHGRWCVAEGEIGGMRLALGIVHPGFHGLDFKDGEIRLSVLRSAAYCHERGLKIGPRPVRKYMDLGVHDFRILLTAGAPDEVKRRLSGLADWLAAPPAVYAHLPIDIGKRSRPKITGEARAGALSAKAAAGMREIFDIQPENIRLSSLKRSEDGKALVIRLQETAGVATKARLALAPASRMGPGTCRVAVDFEPFEMKTLRAERSGRLRPAPLLD
ncbi:MAG: hypothetical protein FJY80_03370, partial [Candidatus Aminicenantes bacterium]|nr:hypothetical protein [Candidatus Aminicenantes bacterium]